jgi:lambda repressor-like predicted transcriptional regulator
MRKKRPRNQAQERYIKARLAERGLTMSSLARALPGNPPAGSVINNIYGYRDNPELRQAIADYLELPVAELFGGNGHGAQVGKPVPPEPRPPEKAAGEDARPTGKLAAVAQRVRQIFKPPVVEDRPHD